MKTLIVVALLLLCASAAHGINTISHTTYYNQEQTP